MFRSLLDDVSVDELLRMRHEEELSNQEIADRLDVNRQTIYRYIGPQPKGMRKYRSKGVVCRPQKPVAKEEENIAVGLVISNRTITAEGADMEYQIDFSRKTVRMHKKSAPNFYWVFTLEELSRALPELQAVERRAAEFKVTPEVW